MSLSKRSAVPLGISMLFMLVSCSTPVKLDKGTSAKEPDAVVDKSSSSTMKSPTPTFFSRDEVVRFIAAAKAAESIDDPLKRCLAYPDPPRSHWPRDVTAAYCRYRLQPMISTAEINALIRNGQTAELDKRFATALQAQLTQPGAQGLLDETYAQDFRYDLTAEQHLLDAWKRASPMSAFAYAASGYAYSEMAEDARGEQEVADTPIARMAAMSRFLALAEVDFKKALALEPRLTPVYVAWIEGANIGRSREFVEKIAKQGLAVAPADYAIYSNLMFSRQPNWGGSVQAMQQLADKAQAQVAKNPLLRLLLTEAPYAEVTNCQCDPKIQLANYMAVFDQMPITAHMWMVGDTAAQSGHPEMVVVYLSETLRFLPYNPLATHARAERSLNLQFFDQPQWELAEARKVVATDPHYDGGYKAEVIAYEVIKDYRHAIGALKTAIPLMDDPWPLVEMGNIYTYRTKQWDDAWDVSNQIIAKYPQLPDGWVQRASIQVEEPRTGFEQTYEEFNARFGQDPNQQQVLEKMRAVLAHQNGAGSTHSQKPK